MHIGFIDGSNWDYSVDTPYERPLGGTQSAMCYLAVELARQGQRVTVLNGISVPRTYSGVFVGNFQRAPATLIESFDIVVVLSWAVGEYLRNQRRIAAPLVLWNQFAHDEPNILALRGAGERKAWSAFAFVSQWQLDRMVEVLGVPRSRSRVMRNAISPAFAELKPAHHWFEIGAVPVLFYTSTPFRGLDVLVEAFPAIRNAVPGARLRVFSSMATYQVGPANDKHRDLYAQCTAMDGVEYVGAIGQRQLAAELAGGGVLAYPSTFAETSCIAVLEAMAAGAAVVTTRLGALPETTGGFAYLIRSQADKAGLAQAFADAVIDRIGDMQADPAAAIGRRDRQIEFIRKNYLWRGRAREWADWLAALV